MEEDLIRKKAILILGGDVRLPEGFRFPYRISRSTAGPGAGKRTAAFSFNGMRVKKGITYDDAEFDLCIEKSGYSMKRNGREFLRSINIEPVVFHSPEQAFFNLDQRCIYKCKFCASPLLLSDATKDLTDEKIVEMIKNAVKEQKVVSVALTSGVVGSVQQTVDRIISCIRSIKNAFPDMIVGVEPYIDSEEQIAALRAAGADEIKINIETPRRDIFEKICPELDHDNILKMIASSVKIFGKGHVTSNIICGLGETDDDVINCIANLTAIGCAPGLRPLKVNDTNISSLSDILKDETKMTPDRMIRLGKEQKRLFEEHGLDTRTFKTMCFECTCCDLVPFRDF